MVLTFVTGLTWDSLGQHKCFHQSTNFSFGLGVEVVVLTQGFTMRFPVQQSLGYVVIGWWANPSLGKSKKEG